MDEKLISNDLTGEKSRQYTIIVRGVCVFEINFVLPQRVYFGPGHRFHRVVGHDGKVYLVPAPGLIFNNNEVTGYCHVAWEPANKDNPCQF